MHKEPRNYICGQWREPSGAQEHSIVNPATEEIIGSLRLSSEDDLNQAVDAAREAFLTFSRTSRKERMALLREILAAFSRRRDDLVRAISLEIGCPDWLARSAQITLPEKHLAIALDNLASYAFDEIIGNSLVRRTPIGVCALITPWNWPAGIIMGKIAPALATGCTVVLKPSECAPLSAAIVAEALHEAGVPPGVFNMIYGDGPKLGSALASHPGVDCVSFTGSVAAGVQVAIGAAPGVKRVLQELGGKSPNIVLPSANLTRAVKEAVYGQMLNSGQNCFGPSRLIVPADAMPEVRESVREMTAELRPGLPGSGAFMGPVANAKQYQSVLGHIRSALDQGASLLAGGPDRPKDLERGYFIEPTVFTDVSSDMPIAREEVFGPVLVIQTYKDVEEAVALANDTEYGLAAYIQGDIKEARRIADMIPAGQIYLNNAGTNVDLHTPFGGFKRSGNGREWGKVAFADFLEYKSIIGFYAPAHPGAD